MIQYHDIPFTSRTVDRSVALAAELIEERLTDEHPALAAAHVQAGTPEDLLDGEHEPHRLADGLTSGLIRPLGDERAVEGGEVELVGDPRRHEVPGVAVGVIGRTVGHTTTGDLLGHSPTGEVAA